MTVSAPKTITWVIALILGIVGILATVVTLPVITAAMGFWLLAIAFILLIIATMTKGL